jgi:hypothetical protein
MTLRNAIARIKAVLLRRVTKREPSRRQRGVALLLVIVTTAILGATSADFAYNSQIELEAAANSRDMLRAEYLARSGLQLGQLLTAVQSSIGQMLSSINIPGLSGMADAIIITDYAGFLAKALSGDAESREGLGGLIGIDLRNVEGLGTPKGTSLDLAIASEEGKLLINCGGGNITSQSQALQRNLSTVLINMVRPQRYDRLFTTADRDGVVIQREDLPIAIIDWTDIDPLRFNYGGISSGAEERYDRGTDRYEAHNHYFDTVEELMQVRGISEDFWGAFGELFTVYGNADCKVLAGAIEPTAWPLIAAMIGASSSDKSAAFDPNTAIVAQQVTSMLKTGLPALKSMSGQMNIPKCNVEASQCPQFKETQKANTTPQPVAKGTVGGPAAHSNTSDSVGMLSDLICSPMLSQLPAMANSLAAMTGGAQVPTTQTTMRPIQMCPGGLQTFLREKGAGGKPARRFFRIDSTGVVQRGSNANKITQTHIRGVWDTQRVNSNPICINHPSCFRGTWVYYRVD